MCVRKLQCGRNALEPAAFSFCPCLALLLLLSSIVAVVIPGPYTHHTQNRQVMPFWEAAMCLSIVVERDRRMAGGGWCQRLTQCLEKKSWSTTTTWINKLSLKSVRVEAAWGPCIPNPHHTTGHGTCWDFPGNATLKQLVETFHKVRDWVFRLASGHTSVFGLTVYGSKIDLDFRK